MARASVRLTVWLALVMAVSAIGCAAVRAAPPDAKAAGPFEPTWESLKQYRVPEWFRDEKFGIYFHWGVYAVPAFGSEWYPRNMFRKGDGAYKHHVETYGDPATFGYHDFVPLFKAEKFDAQAWADLFQKAGARFAGPVAEHHDGFSMWASKLTPWNAKDMGPKRDITGELATAIRKRGMRFVATFHHARNNLWQPRGKDGPWTGHYDGVKRDFPAILDDPKQVILYGYMPREQFLEMWLGKLKEVIDNYQPDLMWFDSWLDEIPKDYQQAYLAHYFNRAAQWGKGVVVTCKQRDLPIEVAVEDFEKGRADRLTENLWLTDDTISRGSWCYTNNLSVKGADEVIDTFIDIVSKNGALLLNISPKADGTIPDNQRQVLLEMGRWLGVNGEAIYNTRPWLVFGEGPTRMDKGGHFVSMRGAYGPQDVRYTRSKDGKTLYAIVLGWPEEKTLTLRSVQVKAAGPGAKVALLGCDGAVRCETNDDKQPVIAVPDLPPEKRPASTAVVFRLTGFDLGLHPEAGFADSGVALTADKAVLEGELLQVEEKVAGRPNIGFWDKADERVHWLVKIGKAGPYRLRAELAAAAGATSLAVEVAGKTVTAEVPATTGGWDKPTTVNLGKVTIEKPGIYHLVLRPAKPDAWKPINIWKLELAPTE